MTAEPPGAVEVRRRLRRVARDRGEDVQLVLGRYGLERLLYRLGRSPHAELFVLKGAMLFHLWSEGLHRPTRDLDLLGYGESSVGGLEEVFRSLCAIEVEDDGLHFDAAAVRGSIIREGQRYQGVRVRFRALLGETIIPIQVDVGFGDAITPSPRRVEYPTLIELPPPVVRVYPPESVVAEKYEALVDLAGTNSRMKDFYDLWMLSRTTTFDGGTLNEAIRQTFARRGTDLPREAPIGLTTEWARGERVEGFWQGFLDRSGLQDRAAGLDMTVAALREFLLPPTRSLLVGAAYTMRWQAGGPWSAELSSELVRTRRR